MTQGSNKQTEIDVHVLTKTQDIMRIDLQGGKQNNM